MILPSELILLTAALWNRLRFSDFLCALGMACELRIDKACFHLGTMCHGYARPERIGWLKGVMCVRSPSFGGSWVPVFNAGVQCSASQSCWPVGLDQQSLYCIIGTAAQPSPQVCCELPKDAALL